MSQSSFFIPDESVMFNLDPRCRKSRTEIEDILLKVLGLEGSREVTSKLDSTWSRCTFSSGLQRQISVARMLLRNDGNVYCLDEPTTG